MNEPEWIERFNHDLGRVLEEAGRSDLPPAPAGYGELLALARRLAAADLSGESQVRQPLRRRLLEHADAPGGWQPRKESLTNTFQSLSLRRRLGLMIAGALALLLAIMLSYPGGPAAAAERLADGLKLIVLGANSTAQQAEAFVTGKPLPDDLWHIPIFPGYGVGGNAPPGIVPEVVTASDLEAAQALTIFDIRVPGYLPEGYTLRQVKVAPLWSGLGAQLFPNYPSAFLFYSGPGADIAIVQQPVGSRPGPTSNTAVGTSVSFMTNGELEEVRFDGHVAAWADGRLLMWEQAGINYTVAGAELDLETARRIAESLK
jgi:hypothetical protein